jgi:hypothetical protein
MSKHRSKRGQASDRQIAPGERLHPARDHERMFSPSILTKASARATPRSVSVCGLEAWLSRYQPASNPPDPLALCIANNLSSRSLARIGRTPQLGATGPHLGLIRPSRIAAALASPRVRTSSFRWSLRPGAQSQMRNLLRTRRGWREWENRGSRDLPSCCRARVVGDARVAGFVRERQRSTAALASTSWLLRSLSGERGRQRAGDRNRGIAITPTTSVARVLAVDSDRAPAATGNAPSGRLPARSRTARSLARPG